MVNGNRDILSKASITGSFGRSEEGFSLRQSLIRQGVTTEQGMRYHLSFINKTLEVNPNLDITRYKVDKNNPNGGVNNG